MNHIPDASTLGVVFIKSPMSNQNDNCVEVASDTDAVYVRNSKHPTGPALAFTREEWTAYLEGAKTGAFDEI